MIRYYSVPKETFVTNGTIVEPLEVTENGTYAPPAGTAYSPVVVNVEGGGGETWNPVFEGSVTTVDRDGFADGLIGDFVLTANSIKVTFNGIEYTCERNEDDTYGAQNIIPTGYDFTEYPFCITYDGVLITPEAGTYTLKIEEAQSGGSSDFSTATMSVIGDPNVDGIYFPYVSDFIGVDTIRTKISNDAPFTIVMYKGSATLIDTNRQITSTEGNIQAEGKGYYLITGDCTITIS